MTCEHPELLQAVVAAIAQTAPLLPPEELLSFVQYYFDRKDEFLQVIEKRPAPLYLQDSAVLKARALELKSVFETVLPSVTFYYAVKSNNHPNIASILLGSGFGLDVSSGLELEMALGLGAQDVVFSGPGKTSSELETAVAYAHRVTILLDSFGELHRLGQVASKLKKRIRCGVRLTVNPKGLWRKFGILPESLADFLEQANRCENLDLAGLQFHSSWNLSPDAQISFIQTLGKVLSGLPESFQRQIEFIDIGGGYWPPQGEWLQAAGTPQGKLCEALNQPVGSARTHYQFPATAIDVYAQKLSAAIHQHLFPLAKCRIFLEPGRWICNDAVHLLISVVDKKAPDLVITDAGTNAVGWERFETDYFPILNLTRPALEEKPCHILGSLCTPHDVWGYMYFGEDIQPGDLLLIPTQGAYTYSLRQTFIKPLPEVYLL